MRSKGLEKILRKNGSLQETWALDKKVEAEMQVVPPHYMFDIRDFADRPFQQRQNRLKQYRSEMTVTELVFPEGIHVMHAQLQSQSDGYLCIDVAQPYIHLFFALQDDRHYYVDGNLLGKLSPGRHQAFLFHKEEVTALWHVQTEDCFVEINIAVAVLESWLPETGEHRIRLEEILEKQQSKALFPDTMQTSQRQKQILMELTNKMVEEDWLHLYTKAKLMELVALVFDQQQVQESLPLKEEISTDMQKLMEEAKRILDHDVVNPPSISELSILLGTNENYLKKYFKLCYQTTIYGYLTSVRMQRAKEMLQQGERPINEISRFLGYNSHAHFSASFKKHFGIKPKILHKQRGVGVDS
ncbi:helix-turn-helix transcriptional regulator [Sphingobacterium sp. LRF_L2]|uniref:helix-turn-helix transcriptional regulator n=1 Tax=Sphingobacterium sp. LRF_L2 TaxID=3369421 RepID=UPI003F62FA0B